jgi:hypothetical protein
MPLNNAQARVIDPINTNVAQGYRHPDHVGMFLFPRVPVMVSGGKIIEFGKEAFKEYSTHRAPGTDTKKVTFGHEGKPYALENHALDGVVPREHQREAQRVPGIDLSSRAVSNVMRIMSLSLERQQAALATDAANYDANHKLTLAGTDRWNNTANSDPIADVKAGREAVRSTVGVYPNVMEIGPEVFNALAEHPKIVEKIKYSQRGIITAELLAAIFDIQTVVVGKAVGFNDAGDTATDFWGKHAVLAYVPQTISGAEEPSYGYTYTLDGHPLVETPYYDKSKKSWVYGVAYERAPVLAGMSAGFLIATAVD